MTEGVGGACGGGGGGSGSGSGGFTIVSLAGRGSAGGGGGGGRAGLGGAAGTPGPLLPARLQAPGLGHQGSCDPSALRAASWGCARTPAPGIMGNGMTKVLPGLYLGNFIDAKDPDQLGRNKITHIISIHESPQPLLQDITYLRIPVADTPEVPIKKHFKECINFIHCCRLSGGNCLVHCFAGISRSTTIVTAYVMTVTGLGWRDVLEAIKATRPIANPNPGFRQQLEEFGWGNSGKLRRQLEERFGESPFRDEEEAWAIYKGKHVEGIDKDDPSTWKTRLRCALNKSADFCEVHARSQLDISNPYKVYRIVSDGTDGPVTRACAPPEEKGILQSQAEPPGEATELACRTDQDGSELATEDKDKQQPRGLAQQGSLPPTTLLPGPLADHRYQAQDPAHPSSPSPPEDFSNPDCWLHVRLFYGAELVREATARTAEGCRLSPRAAAAAAERACWGRRGAWRRFASRSRRPAPACCNACCRTWSAACCCGWRPRAYSPSACARAACTGAARSPRTARGPTNWSASAPASCSTRAASSLNCAPTCRMVTQSPSTRSVCALVRSTQGPRTSLRSDSSWPMWSQSSPGSSSCI
uniref:Dual specificity protein phosphatase 15 n=1 Tax=Equus asinus TaxID=9793 RepID=A0A9L0J133_EQUAS